MTHGQTDRHTDRQTQTDFIICPMLYAIAMGQIIKAVFAIQVHFNIMHSSFQGSGLPTYKVRLYCGIGTGLVCLSLTLTTILLYCYSLYFICFHYVSTFEPAIVFVGNN